MPDTVIKNLSVLTHFVLTQTYRISTSIILTLQFFLFNFSLASASWEKQSRVSGQRMGNRYRDKKRKRATSCWPWPLAARGEKWHLLCSSNTGLSEGFPSHTLPIALIFPWTTLLPKSPMISLVPIQWKNVIPHFLEHKWSFIFFMSLLWGMAPLSPGLLFFSDQTLQPPDLLCGFILLWLSHIAIFSRFHSWPTTLCPHEPSQGDSRYYLHMN